MATHDRYPHDPLTLESVTEPTSLRERPQGELFARLALRQLPIYKSGPEDAFWISTERTLH